MSDAPRTFLLEIGTEEIPARMIPGALEALARGLADALSAAGLPATGTKALGTPRRLALLVEGIPGQSPDQSVEVTGPPASVAFDAQGRPTKAGEGFARAQGVKVEDLRRTTTPRGECVAVRKTIPGRRAAAVLAEAAPAVAGAIPFPKTMRWGSGEHRFVRPVHWVVALLDDAVVPFEICGVRSDRATRGHRLWGEAPLPVARASDYVALLERHGVVVDPAARRDRIAAALSAAAQGAKGRLATPPGTRARGENADPELLDEVTDLVEWPTVLQGEFDPAFLALPQEILLTSMRHHQKYFALVDAGGRLAPRFLAVANVKEDPDGIIRRGHEWVLRARLSDARFFFQEDRKSPLESFGAALERVAFHERLGSYAAKARRIADLAASLRPAFEAAGHPVDAAAVQRAAALSKNDLCTQMVGEFPELQGIVGGLYARADGVPEPVAEAIYDHYLPRSADDAAPRGAPGALLALADRIDTQAGIFLLGLVPTGSRDPYALRRSVQGACRILIERGVRVSLSDTLKRAIDAYAGVAIREAVAPAEALATLLEFWRGRQEFLAAEAGFAVDVVRAALGAGDGDPAEARRRMEAVRAFRPTPGFDDLAAAHKRLRNILAGQKDPAAPFDPAQLKEPAEQGLAQRLGAVRPVVQAAVARGDHAAALGQIASLREPVDRFFGEVMVLAEDPVLRRNRLALLRDLAALFLSVADFSEIAAAQRREG
jgi:glycyl-tRNA synthetase beta chain